MKATWCIIPLSLLTACPDEGSSPTPTPVAIPGADQVIYVFHRTDYCEYYIEGTTFGICGGVGMNDEGGTYRGVAYDDLDYWLVEEDMLLEEVGLTFLRVQDDIGELEVHFSASTLPDADVPFSVRVEGTLWVPWTEFLSRDYPHGDEPYYYVFGTMWVNVMGFERILEIDDQPDYPNYGWGWRSEIAIDHVP